MQKRVLLVALAAFSGGAVTTLIAASYLSAPSAPVAAPAPDLSRVQAVAPIRDEPACEPRTWPYFGPDCSRKPNRGVEAKLASDVSFVVPAVLALVQGTVPVPAASLRPNATVVVLAAVAPDAGLRPAAPARTVEPLRAPQMTEPMRTVEFERSTDAAARQVRLIRIDRNVDGSEPANSGAQIKLGAPAKSAAAPSPTSGGPVQVATTGSTTLPSPPANERAAALAGGALPTVARSDVAAPTAKPESAAVSKALAADPKTGPASGAAAATLPPASPPVATPDASQLDRSASRSRRRLAREEDDVDPRIRRRRDRAEERDLRTSRRDRYGDRTPPEFGPQVYDRRGRIALEEAPSPRGGRRSSSGDRDVFGWLGSSN